MAGLDALITKTDQIIAAGNVPGMVCTLRCLMDLVRDHSFYKPLHIDFVSILHELKQLKESGDETANKRYLDITQRLCAAISLDLQSLSSHAQWVHFIKSNSGRISLSFERVMSYIALTDVERLTLAEVTLHPFILKVGDASIGRANHPFRFTELDRSMGKLPFTVDNKLQAEVVANDRSTHS